jgi:thiamine-monophosphate kinase
MRESNLLRHIYASNASLPATVTIPPGDDMGGLRLDGRDVLVTVDQVADGVHFDLSNTPLQKVARKAITRNLSDVAAMAAAPVGAVVAGCLPRGFGESNANQLFDSMRDAAASFGLPLIGGDISIWDGKLILTVTILAEPRGVEPVTRRGARPGDVICVTGQLGGTLESTRRDDGTTYTHHLDFEPRLALARQLAGSTDTRPHCMIDLSDGIAADLPRLCEAATSGDGGVSAELFADRLPISPAAHAASHRTGRPPWLHALSDGEDYELLFTIAAPAAERALPRQIDGVPITQIGVVTDPADGARVTIKLPDGSIEPVDATGWEHGVSGS